MHRLRDLTRRQALLAAAMVALLLVPFGASLVRAERVSWLPSGDDALIGLRSYDALTADRPLTGQPSTSHLYGPEEGTFHPGPIQFYALAVPLRVLGPSAGMLLAMAAVNLAAVLVAAWVVLRRAGPAVAGWSMVLLSLLLWSEGTAVLSDPISSNVGSIPLIALAALAWALADGDVRLAPLGALVASWVLQQHLAIVIPAAGLVVYAAAALGAQGVVRWRRRTASADAGTGAPDGAADGAEPEVGVTVDGGGDAGAGGAAASEHDGPARWWPWLAGALGVALVAWSPVLWQQLTGDPGNLTAVLTYARESDTDPVGWTAGLRQAVRAVGFPPLLTRSDLTGGDFFRGPLSPVEIAVAVATYAFLVATSVLQWRRRRTLALLAVTALVLAVFGTYNGASIPDSIEAFRINFYRWPFVVGWLAWIALGWSAGLGIAALARRRDAEGVTLAVPRWAGLAAVAVMVVPAVGTVATAGYNDERRDQDGFVAMREMSGAALEATEPGDRVSLVLRGRSAVLASGSALGLQLEVEGRNVVAAEQEARFWGDDRILEPGDDPGDVILQLVSGRGDVPPGPGRTIARYDMNEELRPLLDPLVAQATGAEVEVSAEGEQMLVERYEPGPREYVRDLLANIGTDPQRVLTDDALLELVAAGYYESPTFDDDQIDALREALPAATVNDDDVFELRVLTPDELVEVLPAWQE